VLAQLALWEKAREMALLERLSNNLHMEMEIAIYGKTFLYSCMSFTAQDLEYLKKLNDARPRGRPRKTPRMILEQIAIENDVTDRGALNLYKENRAVDVILDRCSENAQRFFLGGRTKAEIEQGGRKKQRVKRLVLQELGWWKIADAVKLAEAIAERPELCKKQESLVQSLRSARREYTLLQKDLIKTEEGKQIMDSIPSSLEIVKFLVGTEKGKQIISQLKEDDSLKKG